MGAVKKVKEFFKRNASGIKELIILELVVYLLVGVIFINCFVPTESMEPTVEASDFVLGCRVAYKFIDPDRCDVIVFKYPDEPSTVYCKRIVGLPGEVLEVKDGVTYIDGVELEEEYVKNSFTGNYGPFYIPKADDVLTVVNQTAYYNDYVVGGIEFLEKYCRYEDGQYIVNDDCYFCMGDNRDNSWDARFWTCKYVTVDDIKGKLLVNYSKGFKAVN